LGTCIDRFYFGSCCDLGDKTDQVLETMSMRPPLRPMPIEAAPSPTFDPNELKLSTIQVVQGPIKLPSSTQRNPGVQCPAGLEIFCGSTTTTSSTPSSVNDASSSQAPSTWFPSWPGFPGGSSSTTPPSADQPSSSTWFPILPGFPEWTSPSPPSTPEPTLPGL
jgi:hypothetical protein